LAGGDIAEVERLVVADQRARAGIADRRLQRIRRRLALRGVAVGQPDRLPVGGDRRGLSRIERRHCRDHQDDVCRICLDRSGGRVDRFIGIDNVPSSAGAMRRDQSAPCGALVRLDPASLPDALPVQLRIDQFRGRQHRLKRVDPAIVRINPDPELRTGCVARGHADEASLQPDR